jgi:hypothetical protein
MGSGRRKSRQDSGELVEVERLTLDEAVIRLGISKRAVRQQMQQGTLPHGQWPDGGVFVCMDSKDETERVRSSDETGTTNQLQVWLDYVAGASGLAVLFGGLTYALGLLAFWAPIARKHTHDSGAA